MEDLKNLEIEDWKQLVIFYKNKSVELEFASLITQLNHQKTIKEKNDEHQIEVEKITKHFSDESIEDNSKYELIVDFLKKEIEKKDKEILKLKNKKIK